jgi:sarcosine oxidase delta subunit
MSNFIENEEIYIECPHCQNYFIITRAELANNIILRHGILKSSNKWINPYMSNILCERYIQNKKITGCGKHFKVSYDIESNIYSAYKL